MNRIYIDILNKNHDKHELLTHWLKDTSVFIEFEYNSDFGNTKCLRDFIECIGKELKMKDKQISRVILICDELNNNAIEYGSSPKSQNIMRVRVMEKDKKKYFQLEVQDAGDGKAPKTALDMETMRAHKLKRGYGKHNSIRGRGLFLITVKIAERLYFKNALKKGLIVGVNIKYKKAS